MGNDSDKKEKNNDYITFEQIQESVGLKTILYSENIFKKSFLIYLQRVKSQKISI